MIRYPVTHLTASNLLECPVHGCVVVLGDDGRIKTRCAQCLQEARRARRRLADRRRREAKT